MNNFKKVCFGAATMAVMATGSAMSAGSVHAATLTDGSLNITTDTTVTPSGGGLNMVINTTGVPIATGGFLGFTGTPTFTPLALATAGPNTWTTGPVASFMSGISVGGESVFFDILSPITFSGFFSNSTLYALSAPIIDGQFRNASGTILGLGAITGVRVSSGTIGDSSSINLVGKVVPTPALLPGLLGLGAAAWRKRKSEQEAVEA
jgi:hypothetical protein